MKVKAERRNSVRCSICGNVDEGVQFTIALFWIFKLTFGICEGCFSKLFRRFRREK